MSKDQAWKAQENLVIAVEEARQRLNRDRLIHHVSR